MQPFSPDVRIDRSIKIGIAGAVLFCIALMVWHAGWKFLAVPAILLACLGCFVLVVVACGYVAGKTPPLDSANGLPSRMPPQLSDPIRRRQIRLVIYTACFVFYALLVWLKGPAFLIGSLLDAVILGPIYFAIFAWTQRRSG